MPSPKIFSKKVDKKHKHSTEGGAGRTGKKSKGKNEEGGKDGGITKFHSKKAEEYKTSPSDER